MSWWNPFESKHSEQKLESEVRFHLDELIREKMAGGMSSEEARREAVLEFGGAEQLKEQLRDVHRLPFVETAAANLRLALRQMWKSPTFSITVVLTLALGIGANSAVFSAINAILLRPLPFPNGDQLVELKQADHATKAPPTTVAPSRVEDWNRLNSKFQAISGYYGSDVSDTTGSIPERVSEALVAPRFFQVWGVAPQLGRDFIPAEEHSGGPDAIIISHRLWMRRFNGDPNVIGKTLRLERTSEPIVGVMPESFLFPDKDVDIWIPSPPDAPYAQDRNEAWFRVIGRLKPGVSYSSAAANLENVQAQLGRQYPKTDSNLKVDLKSLKEVTVDGSGRSLWMLFAAVSLLLLIACVNIAALLLARATQRQREVSVRFSLGATRQAIVTQMLMECFVLAMTGSALGLAVASGGASLFRYFAKAIPRTEEITLDWRIVLYSLVCAVAATFLSGLLPALRTSGNTNADLTRFSRSQVSVRHPLQWLLVGAQVAMAVTLLMGAGLMLRSFQELSRIQLGFESSHVLTFRISGNWGETTNYPALTQRIKRTLDALRAVPGVTDAATAGGLPGVSANIHGEVTGVADTYTQVRLLEDHSDAKIMVQSRFVSNSYFKTMRIAILSGELGPASPNTVLVNQSFVRAYLGGEEPIGRHVDFASNPYHTPPARIIGVVADAREQAQTVAATPTLYWCVSAPTPVPYFLVRTQVEPMAMAETLRQEIHKVSPSRSVFDISPLEEHLSNNFGQSRLRTMLLVAFSLTAILLACTGLYGTLSYSVTVRKREIGLRLALGATKVEITRSFLQTGMLVAAIGCAAGLALSALFTRALQGMLIGVSANDGETLTVVIATVLGVSLAASFLPAIRAASVEPMNVLREE